MKRYLLIGPAIFILLWWLVCVLKIVDSFFLPDPISVVGKLFQLVFSGIILGDIGATLGRVMIAFAVAIILGWPAGLVLGMSKNVYKSCEFLIDFFRSTPATALFPLFLLVFGISDISKIAAATFAGLLIIIFNTAHGVMHSNHSRILAAEIMGASRFQIFKSILFWESLPQAIIGFRTAVSWSLAVLIVTEMFIGTNRCYGTGNVEKSGQTWNLWCATG